MCRPALCWKLVAQVNWKDWRNSVTQQDQIADAERIWKCLAFERGGDGHVCFSCLPFGTIYLLRIPSTSTEIILTEDGTKALSRHVFRVGFRCGPEPVSVLEECLFTQLQTPS